MGWGIIDIHPTFKDIKEKEGCHRKMVISLQGLYLSSSQLDIDIEQSQNRRQVDRKGSTPADVSMAWYPS